MSEQTDLGAILDAGTATHEAPPMAPMAEPAPQTGDKPTASEPPAAAKPDTEPDHVPRAALMDERKKRQALENQLEQFQRQMQQQRPPQPQQPEIPKDLWWTDPEKAAALQREELQREQQQAIFETRAELSETIVAAQHPDYTEMRDTFAQAAQAAMARGEDYLMRQLMSSPNPAKFAYEMGKRISLANEIQDPQSYRQKIEAEVEANFRKKYGIPEDTQEQSGQQVQYRQPVNSAPVPKSLGKAPSAQPRANNGQYASRGPTPLEDIIG